MSSGDIVLEVVTPLQRQFKTYELINQGNWICISIISDFISDVCFSAITDVDRNCQEIVNLTDQDAKVADEKDRKLLTDRFHQTVQATHGLMESMAKSLKMMETENKQLKQQELSNGLNNPDSAELETRTNLWNCNARKVQATTKNFQLATEAFTTATKDRQRRHIKNCTFNHIPQFLCM